MNDFIKNINDVFQKVFEWVLALLPTSPFSKLELPEPIQNMLGYVNYYVAKAFCFRRDVDTSS